MTELDLLFKAIENVGHLIILAFTVGCFMLVFVVWAFTANVRRDLKAINNQLARVLRLVTQEQLPEPPVETLDV